jgi:hypothetical protein
VAAIALQFPAVAAAVVIAIVAALQEPASGHKPEVADMKGGSEHRPAVAVAVAVAVVVAVVEGGEPHMVVEEPGNIPGLPVAEAASLEQAFVLEQLYVGVHSSYHPAWNRTFLLQCFINHPILLPTFHLPIFLELRSLKHDKI